MGTFAGGPISDHIGNPNQRMGRRGCHNQEGRE